MRKLFNFRSHATSVLNLAVVVSVCMQLCLTPSRAAELKAPDGDVLLTVSGSIAQTNSSDTAEFDYDMIAALPAHVVVTSTPWTDGRIEFTGAALADLLDSVGAQGTVLNAVALNGYVVDIPVSDAKDTGAIIAYLRDGKRMSVRNKGPLWVIYPFDSLTDNQELYLNRAIWQLMHLEVLED